MNRARSPGSQPESSPQRRGFIIQIDGGQRRLTMSDVLDILRETGVDVDPEYGPIPVNPALGRFVVRGTADEEARRRAEAIPGVRLFADPRIKPAP